MVSRNKPVDTADRYVKMSLPGAKPVGLAVIKVSSPVASCSCGWSAQHMRTPVLENKAQRHLDKHHEGRGIWL